MILLSENGKVFLREAVDKDTNKKLSVKDFLNSAYMTSVDNNLTDLDITEKCEKIVSKLLSGFDDKVINEINEIFNNEIKIERTETGLQVLIKGYAVDKSLNHLLLTYLSIMFSVHERFSDYDSDVTDKLISTQSALITKEFCRLCVLHRYVFNITDIEPLGEFCSIINDLNCCHLSKLVASLAMLLIIDNEFCDTNVAILMLLVRATRSPIFAAKRYLYVFIETSGYIIGANTEFLARNVYSYLKGDNSNAFEY